jgi:hypothetical protein
MPPAKSNTVTVNGRQYTLSEFMPEVVPLAKELASNARLLADSPLPVDTDLSEVEQREVQAQVNMAGLRVYLSPSTFLSPSAICD